MLSVNEMREYRFKRKRDLPLGKSLLFHFNDFLNAILVFILLKITSLRVDLKKNRIEKSRLNYSPFIQGFFIHFSFLCVEKHLN